MADHADSSHVEPSLLWDWLAARSLARGLPSPIPDRGGMRVDTASPDEIRRHVFAGADPGISELAASIRAPRIFIKMCGPGERLLALVPPAWRLQPRGYLMTQASAPRTQLVLPPDYRMEVSRHGPAIRAAILSKDGSLAASGYAAEHG